MTRVTWAILAAIGLCGGAGADELQDVNAAFSATYPQHCSGAFLEDGSLITSPDVYAFTYKASWQSEDEPPREMRLYRYQCFSGAYNVAHAFFTVTDDGILPVQFAQPAYRIIYADGGPEVAEDAKVEDIVLTGMTTYPTLTNSEVDAASGTILSHSYWRGIGDASSTGEWRLLGGDFALIRFEIDASYDGEINPESVFDSTAAAGDGN